MNPDTPHHQPRRFGNFIRYSFAVMAGGAFAWLAWNPNPPPNDSPISNGQDRDTSAALSPRTTPRMNTFGHKHPNPEDSSALLQTSRNNESGAITGTEQTHDLQKSVTQTASSADMDDADTADLHSRGPP